MVKKVIKKNDKLFCKFCGREMPYMVNAIGEYRCVQCQHIIKKVKVKKAEQVKTVLDGSAEGNKNSVEE
jgi:ribosomal protein L37AE/L43A